MGLEHVSLNHHGWSALAEGLLRTSVSSNTGGTITNHHSEDGHTPLRWRMLVLAREEGMTFKEIGDMMGMSMQAAARRYNYWKDKICCRDQEEEDTA